MLYELSIESYLGTESFIVIVPATISSEVIYMPDKR